MPIAPSLRKHYGYRWKTYDRPAAMQRAHYQCVRCGLPDWPVHYCPACAHIPRQPRRSRLEGAHLDANPANRDTENIGIFCHLCHRAHDYKDWIAKHREYLKRAREERIDAKDAARPFLARLIELDKSRVAADGPLLQEAL